MTSEREDSTSRWLPGLGSLDAADVDAVEEHHQRRRVDLDGLPVGCDSWHAETAAFETFVVEDEAAAIPKQDLAPVEALAEEDKEMPIEQRFAPLFADERGEAVVAAAQVNRLSAEEDPNTRRERQHERSLATSAAT